MSDKERSATHDIVRQCRQHLESLRAAGLEWLPKASPDVVAAMAEVKANLSESRDTVALEAAENEIVRCDEVAPNEPTFFQPSLTSAEVEPIEERRQALAMLAQAVSKCTRCAELASTRTQTVFGVGRIDPELCFIGEAPGFDEDRLGEPFVGAAGQLLNRIIEACGMKREEVYICNILRCRPPGNRLPLANEAANCREYLEKQLELVRPKFICALGACAAQNLLKTTKSIGMLRGKFHDFNGITVMCTYHPAYLLRTPEKKRDVWEDMKKLLMRMGRPVPAS